MFVLVYLCHQPLPELLHKLHLPMMFEGGPVCGLWVGEKLERVRRLRVRVWYQAIDFGSHSYVGFAGGCLSVARWLELHRMCERAGCRFLFGVNALSGRTRLGANLPECRAVGQISEARRRNQGRSEAERAVLVACSRWRGEWDPSELALLLKAGGARLNGTLAALSYGNELNGCKCWWEGLPAAPGTPPHW